MFVGNAFTTQMARFLLPAYPLTLALVLAGASEAVSKNYWLLRCGCIATLLIFTLFASAADARYSRDFLPVALGITNKDMFLDRMAPDYQTSEFVNAALEHRDGKALVFFRHLYYLRIPYMDGDPASSWLVDPETTCRFAGGPPILTRKRDTLGGQDAGLSPCDCGGV